MPDERVDEVVLCVALSTPVYKNTMIYVIAAFILARFVNWDFAEKKGSVLWRLWIPSFIMPSSHLEFYKG